MFYTIAIILSSLFILALLLLVFSRRKRTTTAYKISEEERRLLQQHVSFYRQLPNERKGEFEKRVQTFLSTTRITGINATVSRLDELLVAASAIIPTFNIPAWQYINLNEVLLYPGPFDDMFNQEGDELDKAGIVGDGPYQNLMILSQYDLRAGFLDEDSKHNTGIHEFVHLVDKTDGAVDGVPETMMDKQYVQPWIQMMKQNIVRIREEVSDINDYGGTNQAEFLAVISEYYFKQPDLLKQNHPELFELLRHIFSEKK